MLTVPFTNLFFKKNNVTSKGLSSLVSRRSLTDSAELPRQASILNIRDLQTDKTELKNRFFKQIKLDLRIVLQTN